jgi:lysophospholipase L1-like esterase
MKKIFSVFWTGAMLFMLCACGGGDMSEKYGAEQMLSPFWSDGNMYAETVMLIDKEDGNAPSGKLAYLPKNKIVVKNLGQDLTYKEGEDYTVSGNVITRTTDSQIPFLYEKNLFGEDMPPNSGTMTFNTSAAGKKLGYDKVTYGEGRFFIENQVSVFYEFDKSQAANIKTGNKMASLPNTKARLESQELLNIVVYGDSIATGCNSTGGGLTSMYSGQGDTYAPYNIAPHTPTWPELFAEGLKKKYGGEYDLLGSARGGETSDWGKRNAKTRPYNPDLGYDPDLVIVLFGINDSTMGMQPAAFKNNMKTIVEDIREVSAKDVEFVLIGTMRCNPYAEQIGNNARYYSVIEELCGEFDGVVSVDIGAVHDELLKEKSYYDMTANGINHPNDFMNRVFAMGLYSLFA